MKAIFGSVHKNLLFICVVVLLILSPAYAAHAQHFVPVDKGSKIEFTVGVKGSMPKKVRGTLSKASGKITFDPRQLNKAAFDIRLAVSTVNTQDATTTNKLKSFSFFNIFSFPEIHFVSTSVKQDRPGSVVYTMEGNLTMKGITKPAKMQFTTTPTGKSYLFRGTMNVDRLAYGIGEQDDVDKYVSVFVEMKTK